MADQATLITRNGRKATGSNTGGDRSAAADAGESGAYAVMSSVAGFGEDLLNLTELQARLAAIELRQNWDAVKTAGAVILAGSILAVASLPVALTGIAEILVSELGLGRGLALLSVAAVAILIAFACVAFGGAWLRRRRLGFPLSREESARNLNWFRTIVRQSGRSPSRR
jgi:uncharacterized membrane protein